MTMTRGGAVVASHNLGIAAPVHFSAFFDWTSKLPLGMTSMAGKVAVVSGAAKGIGFACARALGLSGCGVLVADIDKDGLALAEQQLKAAGIDAATFHCDVGNREQVDSAICHAVTKFGGLDILVANAGIVKTCEFLDVKESDWDDVIRVNLKGVFLMGQAAARQMVEQNKKNPDRGGAIVNMSSVNAVMAIPTIASYNASKGGINNLTRSMALSLAPHNIRVNAVGPGSIMTEVLQAVASNKEAMNNILSRTPMGRVGEPSEVANVVKFLASDDSSYITGQIIYVDGGRMALNYTVPIP